MTWRIMLSEYPESVLSDRVSLVLLAFLERHGMLTEEELCRQSGITKLRAVKSLLALHSGKFVEYARQHIKVTERGQSLLDRFSLQTEIIESLLTCIDIPNSNQGTLRHAVLQYRKDAFDRYIESITAMHSWNYLCQERAFSHDNSVEDASIGSLAILLNDVETWELHNRRPQIEQTLTKSLRKNLQQNKAGSKKILIAQQWLDSARKQETQQNLWDNLRSISENSQECLFVAHQFTRKALDTTLWLDNWSNEGPFFLILKTSNSGENAIDKLSKLGKASWEITDAPTVKSLRWQAGNTLSETSTSRNRDILLSLFSADSLEQLAGSIGENISTTEEIVINILERCKELIEKNALKKEESQHDDL